MRAVVIVANSTVSVGDRQVAVAVGFILGVTSCIQK